MTFGYDREYTADEYSGDLRSHVSHELDVDKHDTEEIYREIRRLKARMDEFSSGNTLRASAIQGVIPVANGGSGAIGNTLGAVSMWTNNSGATQVQGTVVVENGNRTFGTTTTIDDPLVIGVLDDASIAVAVDGRIRTVGYQSVLKTQGVVTAGHYLRASATVGRAEDAGVAPTAGSFAIALTASGGGAATVAAEVFPPVGNAGGPPTGAAGGELAGTYPNPTVVATHSGSAHHALVSLAADADVLLGLSTQQLTLDSQTANQVFAGPASGGAADPTFRALVAADVPIDVSDISSIATVATTDATVTTLQTIAAPASTTMSLETRVVARRTGGVLGTAEDGASYLIYATVKNVAGTATIVGAVVSLSVNEDQVLWDATIDVNAGNVRVRVTGAAQNNVDWKCATRTLSVT